MISIANTIFKQQEKAFTRRTVTPSDKYKYSRLSFDGAGSLETERVFIGPTEEDTHPLKLNHLIFRDTSSLLGDCYCFAISPDGKLLAASPGTSNVLVWRLSDGLLILCLHGQNHTGYIQSLAFSPNSLHLVSKFIDNTAVIWNTRRGRVLLRLKGHSDLVQKVAYSPDESHIATNSDNGLVKIWNVSNAPAFTLLISESTCISLCSFPMDHALQSS